MIKARVLISFSDKENNKVQVEGNIIEISEERFNHIKSINNNLLEETEDNPNDNKDDDTLEFPKHSGGGWYLLSNGEKIKGKEEAMLAEEELQEYINE